MVRKVNIIGAGTLGQTLGRLFVNNNLLAINGIYNRTFSKAKKALDFIGQGVFYAKISELPHAEITLITTSDDYIKQAADLLNLNENIQAGDIVAHCSGVLSSECLSVLKNRGCLVASLHPMRSFIQPSVSAEQYPGTYCALEGDLQARLVLEELFSGIGSKVYTINQEKKAVYHAAGVFASNYLLTLAQQSLDCLEESGLEKDKALSVTLSLMHSTLANLEKMKSPKTALTGPIKRGDTVTIEKHLQALNDVTKKELYNILAKATKHLL